jgi:hypothetical protein
MYPPPPLWSVLTPHFPVSNEILRSLRSPSSFDPPIASSHRRALLRLLNARACDQPTPPLVDFLLDGLSTAAVSNPTFRVMTPQSDGPTVASAVCALFEPFIALGGGGAVSSQALNVAVIVGESVRIDRICSMVPVAPPPISPQVRRLGRVCGRPPVCLRLFVSPRRRNVRAGRAQAV